MKNYILIIVTFIWSIHMYSQEKVGINISAPQFTLDARGTSSFSGGIFNLGSSDNTYFIRLSPGSLSDPKASILWQENFPLIFKINKRIIQEVARFDPNGNFGVGNSNPEEKLDVDGNVKVSGNINLTGEITPGGVSGNAGQVLQSNGSGGMGWSNPSDFNFKGFLNYDTWTVPSGVTRVIVEIWGGGGGGCSNNGGGSGAYLKGMIDVIPGDELTIDIGEGGLGELEAELLSQSGESSYVYKGLNFYRAYGGSGCNSSAAGDGGMPGVSSGGTDFQNYFSFPGEDGKHAKKWYHEIGVFTTGAKHHEYGRGGNGAFSNSGGQGGFKHIDDLNGTSSELPGANGKYPAGGGGGHYNFGYNGGNGYVIIWWKSV